MKKFRYYFFLFKFFLIGKNHCDIDKNILRMWYVIHKLLWSFIAFSVSYTTYSILNILVN